MILDQWGRPARKVQGVQNTSSAAITALQLAHVMSRTPLLFAEDNVTKLFGHRIYLADGTAHHFGGRPVEGVSTRSARIPLRVGVKNMIFPRPRATAKSTELIVNLTCGNCGVYSLSVPVDVMHDLDDYDLLSAVCPKCDADNELKAD